MKSWTSTLSLEVRKCVATESLLLWMQLGHSVFLLCFLKYECWILNVLSSMVGVYPSTSTLGSLDSSVNLSRPAFITAAAAWSFSRMGVLR